MAVIPAAGVADRGHEIPANKRLAVLSRNVSGGA
jgi:hypothetical protein